MSIYVQPTTTITETSLSIVINELIRVIQGNQYTTTNIYNGSTPAPSCCVTSYALGEQWMTLSGQGSFSISGLVGLLVEVTQPPANQPVLEGNPPYLFNAGWMAIEDGNGMLEEKRVTRTSFVWLPSTMRLATAFNYDLFHGAVIAVTALTAA